MKYDAKIHHRRSIRLPGYDYALPGAYFVTLCAFHKQCIFGRVVEDRMYENDCGKLAREQWLESAQIRQEFALDAFIVMPNHLHGILWILGPKREGLLMGGGFAQPIVGADGVRPPDAQTPVGPSGARPWPNAIRPYDNHRTPAGASRARPLAERRSALQTPRSRRGPIPAMRSHSLASWAAGFKSALTSRIRELWNRPRAAVWQEDYFEHIIRDEDELFRIREYILSNPARWKLDRENPEAEPGSEEEWPWNPDET
jgi:REP element-mobilizing transposase RayT